MPLRKASDQDKWTLWDWRLANAEFFPPGPELTVNRHLDWWQRWIETPRDHMYMVVTGPPEFNVVGTLSIDVRSKNIGRVMRGRPEGKGAMGQAVFELMNLYGKGMYTLQVLEGNQHAVEFYEHLGFRARGRYHYQHRKAEPYTMINMLLEYSP
jgi:hypothetical protein